MNSLQNKVIIYDQNCPMCSMYTKGFVKWGLLNKDNRIAFNELQNQEFISQVDWYRAKHEIPLIDVSGNKTVYGLDALILIITHKIPFLKPVLTCKPVYSFFSLLYNLVSYNRRIIVPSFSDKPASSFDCTPDFHFTYRIGFIIFSILSSIIVTYAFGQSINLLIPASNNGLNMLLIAGTGWIVQLLVALLFLKENSIEYIGHLSVVMLIGVLILVPGIWLNNLTNGQYVVVPITSVLLSSSTMLWQHSSRVRHLQLSQIWTCVWFLSLQTTALFWIIKLY